MGVLDMMTRLRFLIGAAALAATACGGSSTTPADETMTIPTQLESTTLAALKTRTVFFGHQSVGQNIMEGVADLLNARPDAIRLTAVAQGRPDPAQLTPGTLLHTAVGTNGDPYSKIRAFTEMMHSGLGEAADVALFKFCYIDVEASTDVDRLFAEYRQAMTALSERYPATRFVHVTMPLRMVQTGPKAWIKRTLGRPLGGHAENILRNRYNDLLRTEYEGKQPFFDLARVESTLADGSRVTFRQGDREFFALNPSYTPDNGHLNEQARVLVAGAFLNTLVAGDVN